MNFISATTQPQSEMLPDRVRLLEAMGGSRSELFLSGLEHNAALSAYRKSIEDLGKFLDDIGSMFGRGDGS